jgi:hypothetical protein
MAVESFSPPMKGKGLRSRRGSVSVWVPSPALLVVALKGYGEGEFCELVIPEYQRLTKAGPINIFFDLGELGNYDSEVRTRLTEQFRPARPRLTTFGVLVGSRLVSMGVAVANLALGNAITTYHLRDRFLEALDRKLFELGVMSFSSLALRTPSVPARPGDAR